MVWNANQGVSQSSRMRSGHFTVPVFQTLVSCSNILPEVAGMVQSNITMPLLPSESLRSEDSSPEPRISNSRTRESSTCCRSTLYFLFVSIPLLLYVGLRLFVFVILLLVPGFLQFAWYYNTCDRKVERYQSESCRQSLDIYGSADGRTGKPVLVFFPGGAWLIGYKMWGALTARALAPFGILVIICDYRNYPWGTVPDMVDDVRDAVQWSLSNCALYGGDANKIVVCGQSAGGHLVSTVMLQYALHNQSFPVAGVVSLSSPYNLNIMTDTFKRCGLGGKLLNTIFGGPTEEFDPQAILSSNNILASSLPRIAVFHGSLDKTVPPEGSQSFVRALQQIGVAGDLVEYEDWSHTDAILEGLMDADHRFHRDLCRLIEEWTDSEISFDESHRGCSRMSPHCIIRIARWVNPF